MCEILFDLPTYMQSIKCVENCDVFYISKRSYDRIIAKRNHSCITKMQEYVYIKLLHKNKRLNSSSPIDLYLKLQEKLENCWHLTLKTNNIPENSFNKNLKQVLNNHEENAAKEKLNMKLFSRMFRTKKLFFEKNLIESNNSKKEFFNINTEKKDQNLTTKPNNINSNINFEYQNEKELENLEDRIKRWYLNLGCKKVIVNKLNRIEINVIFPKIEK